MKENKDYILELENKNKQLESKIVELKIQTVRYKCLMFVNKIGSREIEEEIKFIQDEGFRFQELGSFYKTQSRIWLK